MAMTEVSRPTRSDVIHATDRGIALSGRDYVSLDLHAVPKSNAKIATTPCAIRIKKSF